jgi:pyruvate-formate lyase-activating enzyme
MAQATQVEGVIDWQATAAKVDFSLLRQSYMDYPRHVHIETVGMCNARCSFCPNGVMARRGKKMSDALFHQIVSDLRQIPSQIPFDISPFKVNEPLLDAQIFERMRYLTEQLPNAVLTFTSNFSLANEEAIERLSEIPRIDGLWVSLNSLEPEEYQQWMGLPLERTVRNVCHLLEVNRRKPFVSQIALGRVADDSEGDVRFVHAVRREFAEFESGREYQIAFLRRGQWMGHAKSSFTSFDALPCQRWFELSITCTGEVAFCCMDGLCRHPLGNVKEQSVLDVYNDPAYKEVRSHCPARCYVDPCVGCSFL